MEEQMNSSSTSSGDQGAAMTYTVDSFANGIAFGQHLSETGQDPRELYSLRLEEDTEMIRLRSRYALHREKPLFELEKNLMRLSSRGILRQTVIYFGTTTDPFHPFKSKFDASMKFLELFKRYVPGILHVQTRSPLLVLALPVLQSLGRHVSVTIGIETCDEALAQRYTPDLPRVAERLKTACALQKFGIEVNLQVSPVLPYGDWRKDAGHFAEILAEHADHVFVQSITDGSERVERQLKGNILVRKLAEDRKFHYLRPDSANPLISALEAAAPAKLGMPKRPQLQKRQLSFFAA